MRRYYRGYDPQRILSVAEMAHVARHRLPGFAWEYLQGGAEDESTLQCNRSAFQQYRLHSKTLVPNDPPILAGSLVGSASQLPLAIGPSGFNGMLWPNADVELARAATAHGVPFTLSTVANASLEQVRQQVPDADLWFQLYALKDPSLEQDLLQRALKAGCSTLVVTSDALVVGNREWDRRNFASPRQLTLANKLNVLTRPGWLWRVMVPAGLPTMGNLNAYLPDGERTALGAMQFIAEQLDTRLDWQRLAAIRANWPGKMILKGVLHPDDARMAISLGLDGVVVSNHGGRQLDGASSSLDALARIAPVVDGRISLLLDGGVRRGTDIIKALALGAEGVLLARTTLYGVAAYGGAGVDRVLTIVQEELGRSLNLMGCRGITSLDRRWLLAQGDSQ
ncbi:MULTISPECIES: alpha-hydroxy acid oxidase [unclassified Oceanobacter]|uniref:alpha-hydroxy acid oxidase n=2 Tax=Gammaproteobacteria TaxID=1236 RepID=UPI0027329324|nr:MULTISPECIES: alpha-hydroxy acid oxidase [unclassified Oceanobacter]MDP2504177.1 alpha-hydroxy acid oxidase [Oceanobacter sp. 3_MG-2023]MDP2546615.1 alpha-hydroxy acid oxidase [Oceanobacter sp. 4_MG-2023]